MGATFKATLKGDIKAQAQAQMRARAKRLEVLLEQEVGEIVARTQSGSTITGGPFREYSKAYGAAKAEKTGSARPNLTVTGHMLESMRVTVKTSANIVTGTIYFLSSQAIKAFANQKLRRFFGFSNEQKQRIIKGLNNI